MKFLLIFFILILFFCPELICQDSIDKIEPLIIEIKSGDNLWNIAKKYYGSGYKFLKVWHCIVDTTLTNDPDLIYPGMHFCIYSTNKDFSNKYNREIKNDILKTLNNIHKTSISIDSNIAKLIPEEDPYYIKKISVGSLEFIISILGGIISGIATYFYTKRYSDE